jgi:hypothetical protein
LSAIDPQFAADFTDRYGSYLNPLPEINTFREFLKFAKSSDKSGKQFRYPVQAAISHGITTDRTGTAFALKAARPGVELEAILDGTDLIVRETFPYSAMLKARNGTSLDGNAAAYWDPMDKVMMTTLRAMELYNELMLMYGPGSTTTGVSSLGVIATAPVFAGTGPNYNSGTHPIVQLTSQSWAAGIWNNAGSGGGATSGMLVDIYQADLTTLRAANIQVEGVVDPSLCQVQMTGTSASAVTATDVIVPAGWINTTSVGVGGILRNTGTFANISATTNPFWRSRVLSAGNSTMSAAKFLAITSKLMSNGGDKGLTAWCNPIVFNDLVGETLNSTRWINGQNGDNKAKMQGADTIEFMTAVGACALKRHPYMKQGEMWLLEPETCMRIGASDITFRGANGNEGFFLELTGNAGSEIRAMSQQAALLTVPWHNAIITNIQSANADTSGS